MSGGKDQPALERGRSRPPGGWRSELIAAGSENRSRERRNQSQLFYASSFPHLVWDTVLGVVAGYGLRSRE
jgi:hypothetical protein